MKYGLIGERLGHSYSKLIHERISDYTYELKPLRPDEIGRFIKEYDYKGLNVTIPYKQTVIPMLDEISPEAEKIGSVNTIVRRDNRLFGYNTDYAGFLYLANHAGISFAGRKVMILGTGGTSRTARAVAADNGSSEIVIVSRSGLVNYETVYDHGDAEIIINTTPVGMYPDSGGRILDLSRFPSLLGVLDVVYNPLRTNLILDAQGLGINACGGLPMLVQQAVAAAELFTGEKTEPGISRTVLRELYSGLQNIVLIGMPGAGKTTVGEALARKMGRNFVDIDAAAEAVENKKILEIFADSGEAYFRALEKSCIADAARDTGTVIATGGGAVLDPENMRALQRTGRVYFLDRSLELLPTDGRPLSTDKSAVRRLHDERYPLYTKYCNKLVSCDKAIDGIANEIMEDFYEAACG